MYIFGPPGWSPDGSTKTVRQMQQELKRQKKINKLIPIKDIEESILNGKAQLVPEPKAEEEAELRENSFA
jgi:hypothetical protein